MKTSLKCVSPPPSLVFWKAKKTESPMTLGLSQQNAPIVEPPHGFSLSILVRLTGTVAVTSFG